MRFTGGRRSDSAAYDISHKKFPYLDVKEIEGDFLTTQGKMSIRKKGSKGMDTGITYPAMKWRDKFRYDG